MADYDWQCLECGHEWDRDFQKWHPDRCPRCGSFHTCTVEEVRQAAQNNADDADREDRSLKI